MTTVTEHDAAHRRCVGGAPRRARGPADRDPHRRGRVDRLRHPRLPRQGRARAHAHDRRAVPRQRRRAATLLGRQPSRLAGVRRRRAQRRPPRARRRSRRAASPPASSPRTSTACTCAPAAAASSSCTARCAASSARTAARSSTGATSPSASRPTTPGSSVPENVPLGPDGDVLPESTDGFRIPACTVCDGMLKPDVVFFGEFIPAEKFREAEQLVRASDALVIAGSSLVVNSGIRLLERARRRRLSDRDRQPRRDARRRPGDRQGRRGHERSAAGARRRPPDADRGPHPSSARLGSTGDTSDPRPPRRDRLEPRSAHPGLDRHPPERHRPGAGAGCRGRRCSGDIVVASDLSRARETAEIIADRAAACRRRGCTPSCASARTARPRASRPRSSSGAGATGTAPRSPGAEPWPELRAARSARAAPRSCATRAAQTAPAAASVIVVTHGALIRELIRHATGGELPPAGERLAERIGAHDAVRARAAAAALLRGRVRLGSAAWQPRSTVDEYIAGFPPDGRRAAAADPRGHPRRSALPPRRRSATASPRSCSAGATPCTSPAGRSTSASIRCRRSTSRSRARSPRTAPRRTRSSSRTRPVPYELIGAVAARDRGAPADGSVRERLTARAAPPARAGARARRPCGPRT